MMLVWDETGMRSIRVVVVIPEEVLQIHERLSVENSKLYQ